MDNNYVQFLKSFNMFSEEEIEFVMARVKTKRLRKRQYHLQEGEICKESAWVISGCLRMFVVDDLGREHILDLLSEGRLVADRLSLYKQIPTQYAIDALEETTLLVLSMKDIEEIVAHIPKYLLASNQATNQELANQQSRNVMLLTLSAEEKYKALMRLQPDLIARVPQHMIASYLGITSATLSRIRKLLDRRAPGH
jgi:CRP-like cAMP-binding protein